MRVFLLVNSLMKKHIPFILLSIMVGTLTILSNVGMLATSSVLIAKAAQHPDVLDLMVFIVGVRFFGISRGVFRYLERIISHNTTFKILSSLRQWFYKCFQENYSENKKEFKTGDIYTNLVNDVDSLKEFFLRVIYPLTIAVLTGILTTIFIGLFNQELAIIYMIFYILVGFLLPAIMFRLNHNLIRQELLLKKEMNLLFLDLLKGITEITVFNLRESFNSKYHEQRKEFVDIQNRKNRIGLLGDSIFGFCVTFMMTIALIQLVPYVYHGDLQGIYYAMLPLAIMGSFEALLPMPMLFYKNNEASNAGRNIFSIIGEKADFDVDTDINADADASNATDADTDTNAYLDLKKENNHNELRTINISIQNMCALEPDSKEYILENISFELPQGKRLAIVGNSGSGKSTILKIILGFMKYSSGNVRLGDMELCLTDMEETRKLFTYVEQSPYVFHSSIQENLMIAGHSLDLDMIMKALKAAKIENLIDEMPDGMSSIIGQFGSKISGGEKQRLAIARAMLKPSPIVLLDEPTAGLDVELEKEIIGEIHKFLEDKSCIWVTHRLVSMEKMDEIILMKDGKIIERGTHQQLLERKGNYYNLWKIQQQFIQDSFH